MSFIKSSFHKSFILNPGIKHSALKLRACNLICDPCTLLSSDMFGGSKFMCNHSSGNTWLVYQTQNKSPITPGIFSFQNPCYCNFTLLQTFNWFSLKVTVHPNRMTELNLLTWLDVYVCNFYFRLYSKFLNLVHNAIEKLFKIYMNLWGKYEAWMRFLQKLFKWKSAVLVMSSIVQPSI